MGESECLSRVQPPLQVEKLISAPTKWAPIWARSELGGWGRPEAVAAPPPRALARRWISWIDFAREPSRIGMRRTRRPESARERKSASEWASDDGRGGGHAPLAAADTPVGARPIRILVACTARGGWEISRRGDDALTADGFEEGSVRLFCSTPEWFRAKPPQPLWLAGFNRFFLQWGC